MSSDYTYIHCYANAPFTAGVPAALVDSNTALQAVLPSGMIPIAVYTHSASAFAGIAGLSVGWSGSNGALLAPAAGCTTTSVNAHDSRFDATAPQVAQTADEALTITADSGVTSGSVQLVIACAQFSAFP
jgi:hypothetical protein